ncbi:MAG: thioredoxin [Candidatus Omnitrophica bacterium CG07_land_8_20_14_0_80_42_15]|uniref:Thioredoxin n=1 Tax=Candidatus Aquitaenariimonas noxiae TaxID=1974741 RepID=A0A2J0KQE5_9BACT|nr:MAG: thioredoxin [Candidatus Omnitrophica bacterium CG07_land_8_20_14_0_80_42_15]
MENIKNITDENFENLVLGSGKVFVLDFFSDWCQPCKRMEPVLKDIAEDLNGKADFGKIDISANTQVPSNYGVMSIPTFIIFKGKEEVKRIMGITQKEKFRSEIESVL